MKKIEYDSCIKIFQMMREKEVEKYIHFLEKEKYKIEEKDICFL